MKKLKRFGWWCVILSIFIGAKCEDNNGGKDNRKEGGIKPIDEGDRISPLLYSFNTANLFLGYDNNAHSVINEVNPQAYRFPGGTIANFFHPDGKGYGFNEAKVRASGHTKMTQKVKKYNKETARRGSIMRNHIDDIITVKQNVNHSKMLFVVNLIDGTIQEAKRSIDKLQKAGFDIVGIELGNELYTRNFKKVIPSVDEYIKRAKPFASELKRTYPNIPLSVVAAPIRQDKVMKKHRFNIWNEKLAQETFYDAIVHHSYPKMGRFKDENGSVDFDKASQFLLQKIARNNPKEIEEYKAIFGADKKLWITEWNILPTGASQFGNSMLQAIYNTAFLMELTTNSDYIEMASFHNLSAESDAFSIFNVETKGNRNQLNTYSKTCTYYPFFMFKDLFDNNTYYIKHEYHKNKSAFVYEFKKGNKTIFAIINWSNSNIKLNSILSKEMKADVMDEFYANNLSASYTKQRRVKSIPKFKQNTNIQLNNQMLKPYSITKIIIDNENL